MNLLPYATLFKKKKKAISIHLPGKGLKTLGQKQMIDGGDESQDEDENQDGIQLRRRRDVKEHLPPTNLDGGGRSGIPNQSRTPAGHF